MMSQNIEREKIPKLEKLISYPDNELYSTNRIIGHRSNHQMVYRSEMYKLDRILCPTDFSIASIEVINVAAFAAEQYNGNITLMYVDESSTNPPFYFERDENAIKNYNDHIEEFAREKFVEIQSKIQLGSQQTQLLIKYGTAYKEIIREAETKDYSAITISTQGLSFSSPHLIGRTAERIIRLSRSPVITMRPLILKPWVKKIETILCPTDFSEYGNYALPYALSLAHTFKARLLLLHVSSLAIEHPERLKEQFPDPRTYHSFAHEISIDRLVDKDIDPENAIVRVATEQRADLIVMGTHGARGMRRVQIGNTTEEVIRRVEMPVLSITHPIHKVIFPHRFREEYQQGGNS